MNNSYQTEVIKKTLEQTRYTHSDLKFCPTVLDCLNQMSGFRLARTFMEKFPQKPESISPELIVEKHVLPYPLDSIPGSVWKDEDVSYECLALVVEKITGKPFVEWLEEELIKLGLNDTFVQRRDELFLNKSRGAQIKECKDGNLQILNATYCNYERKLGSSALCTTVKDLNKMWNIILNCMTVDDSKYPLPVPWKKAQELGEPVGAACAPFGLSGNKQFQEIKTKLGEVVRGRARGMWMEDVRYLETDCGPVVAVWESGHSMESSVICLSLCRVDQKNDRITTAKFTAPEKNNQSKVTDDRVTTGDYEFFDTDMSSRSFNDDLKTVTVSIILPQRMPQSDSERDTKLYEIATQVANLVSREYGITT